MNSKFHAILQCVKLHSVTQILKHLNTKHPVGVFALGVKIMIFPVKSRLMRTHLPSLQIHSFHHFKCPTPYRH